jgi:hypothetical protein
MDFDQFFTYILWLLRYTVLVGVRLELARHLVSERGIYSHLIVARDPKLKLARGPVCSSRLFRSEAPSRSSSLFSFELSK